MKVGGSAHEWHRITLQSLPVLTATVIVGVLAGQVLAAYQEQLLAIPVLLALVPAVNGIGGNVGSILGARVATGLHLGSIWSGRARGFRRDITASMILGVSVFAFVGLLAGVVAPLLGVAVPVSVAKLALSTLLAGVMLVTAMVIMVIVVGTLSHRYGWDPDNVVVPVLTTTGDVLGIVFLLFAGGIVGL